MKTMIVVDDEYLVRVGIRETIDWEAEGFQIVGEAAHGRAGFELIERLNPDIVISDIKMPVMDGVELVKAIKAKNLDLALVILSGFKDFDFAKGALEHGATEYLLKPIDNKELIAAVHRAGAGLDRIRERDRKAAVADRELPAIRQSLFAAMIRGESIVDVKKRLEAAGIVFPPVGRVIYGTVDDRDTFVDPATYATALDRLAKEFTTLTESSLFCRFDDRFFLIVPIIDSIWENQARVAVNRYEANQPASVSIGLSGPFAGWESFAEAYQAARRAATNKFFPALSTVQTSSETDAPWKPLVIRAMAMIARDYAKNLTVKKVTDELYVSESYLLHTFKENTGVTFNECLTNYRILSAKRLLLENRYKVYEIAGMVGYSDQKYFSSIFKKSVGMTPTEYVERNSGRTT
ncbi:MAG: response regulator [bacterium]